MTKKKEKTTMQKMSRLVSWGMLIAIVFGVGFPLFMALRSYFNF